MKAASGLAVGRQALPELARDAVTMALAQAGLQRADSVLLFLTRDFARHAQPAVVAAARSAGCLAVAGSTASGVLTEQGWQFDQPAAAALVIGETSGPAGALRLSFSGQRHLPADWQSAVQRAGLVDADAAVWSQGRLAESGSADLALPDVICRAACAVGLRQMGDAVVADLCQGYELRQVAGLPARDALLRALPAEWRERPPLHRIAIIRDAGEPAIAVLAIQPDGSLLLSETIPEGAALHWAVRQPLAAHQQMRECLAASSQDGGGPDFALLFSCIGRGPLFYGDDDLDLIAFRERFPGVPLLGAYGSGQIVALPGGNRLFHNAALTLLFESSHV